MTKELLDKIKIFAEENWMKDPDEPDVIKADHPEIAVTDPWLDESGRFPLTDEEAVKEWGLVAIIDFCEKALKVLDCDEKQTNKEK